MKKRQRWQGFSLAGCAVWLATACIALGLIVSCAFQAAPLQDGGRTAESSAETETDAEAAAATDGSDDGAAESADGTSSADDTEVGQQDDEAEADEDVIELDDWTFIVYMAADNNLESAAIADFNELEAVDFPLGVNVLVLFDRAAGNDASNGDWTDTRLFSVAYDKNNAISIVSERLDCPELELTTTTQTELDMANTATLSGLLSYAARAFPARHYGLIMWGHGTGWRGDDSVATETAGQAGMTRAFALDAASDTYLSIADLRTGIQDGLKKAGSLEKLDIIGFDTCFGICLETAYELRDCAQLLMGTPALVPASGWDYANLFSLFLAGEQTALSFAQCALQQYQAQYATYEYASFSVVDCAQVQPVVQAFNTFARETAAIVDNADTRRNIRVLLQDECVTYRADTYPTDCYIDVQSVATRLSARFSSVSVAASRVIAQTAQAIPLHWQKQTDSDACGMGVFYAAFESSGVTAFSHDALYINGSRQTNQCQFVSDCDGYVPSEGKSNSLLDVLFYATL